MASSSELSIEDWKRVLNSSAAHQMHPKELQALDRVVAAADQARHAQSNQQIMPIKPHLDAVMSIAKQLTSSGMPVQMAQTSSTADNVQKRSPAKRGSFFRQSPIGQNEFTELRAQQQQHAQEQSLQRQLVKDTDQGLQQVTAERQDESKQQAAHISQLDDNAEPQSSKHVQQPSRIADALLQQQQHVPAARRVLVDQQQKWQRISDWISRDSAAAATASGSQSATEGTSHIATSAKSATGGAIDRSSDVGEAAGEHLGRHSLLGPDADTITSIADVRYSLETAMMELELARNRASNPHISQDRQEQAPLHQQTPQAQQQALVTQRQHDAPVDHLGSGQQPQQPHPRQQHAHLVSAKSGSAATPAGDKQPMQIAALSHTAEVLGPMPLQQQSPNDLANQQAPVSVPLVSVPECMTALQEQLQQEKHMRQQEQQSLLSQQRMVADLQQQVQQLLQQQVAVAAEHREQMQKVQVAAAEELEQAKQLLEQERQQLRTTAADVLAAHAQQQAAALQEQAKCKALEQQLQEAQQVRTQQQEELQLLQEMVATMKDEQQQHEAQQQQLSARLKEAVDQKQELWTKVTTQLQDLQQQLEECRTALMQSAAEKASLTAELAALDRAKVDLEGRLELAAAEVTQMRDVIGQMAKRLDARDKAVSAQIQEFQQQQLSAQQCKVQEAQAALDATAASAYALRSALIAIHAALSPQSLSAALGVNQTKGQSETTGMPSGFKLDAEQYEALSKRLLSAKVVAAMDAEAVAERVRELLSQVRSTALSYERAEAAANLEAQSAAEQLQCELDACNAARQQLVQQQHQAEYKLATAGEALAAATNEIEQLTMALEAATARQYTQQAPDAAADSALAEKVAQLRDELTDCKTELEACRQQVQMAEQDKAAGVEAVNVEHHKQQVLIDDIHRLRQQLEKSQQAAEAKDERIKELRAALGALMQAKQDLEASLDKERSTVQQAMAVSLQQHEEEYKQQLETIQTLQQEHADLQLQLQTAQAAIRQSQDALDKAHSCLQQLLVQIQVAAEEAVTAISMQAAENRPQQLPLCRQLQQQLAMELSRLPRMASEPESQLESAVPVMLQLPQLIVSVLMAIVEQHAAEQAHEQKIVCDLSAAAADAAGAIFAAIQQLTGKQVQLQNSELPSNPSATKEQLEEAIQELQSAVTSLVESAALQGTQIGVLQEQIAELQAKAELATKAQGTADSDAHILRQQLSAAEVQIEKLQSELQLVLETTQSKRTDLEDQVIAAQRALETAQEAARQEQTQYEQIIATSAADLAAVQQAATSNVASLQDEVQQLQQKLEAVACQLAEKEGLELQLQHSKQETTNLQQQVTVLLEDRASAQQQMTHLIQQQCLLTLQAGHRLRAAKRAAHSLKAVRARRCQLVQNQLFLQKTYRQQLKNLHGQQQELKTATVRLCKLQQERDSTLAKLSGAAAKIQELQAKCARAEALASKLEERCSSLGIDKRRLQGQVTDLQSQVTQLEEKRKMSLHHTTSAQSQADAAKKEAERIKSRCSNAEQSQQQLFEQLLQAEAGLRCSRETNSMLLAEGKKLELQVQQLTQQLDSSRQKVSSTVSNLILAQEEIVNLQSTLLQKTAVAEAAQAQLAAAVLLHSAEQAAANAAGVAVGPAVDACKGLAAQMKQPMPGVSRSVTPAGDKVLQGMIVDDPKCQRIHELRAALAAALSEAAAAAAPAVNRHQPPDPAVPTKQTLLSLAPMQFGQCHEPKMLRIHELTVALVSAAGDVAAVAYDAPICAKQTADVTIDDDDTKTKRMQELRAALAEAMKERDELKHQLAGSSNVKLHRALLEGQQQLAVTKQESEAQQDTRELQDQLAAAHARLSELEASLRHAHEQQQQLKASQASLASAQQLQQTPRPAEEALVLERPLHAGQYVSQTQQLEQLAQQFKEHPTEQAQGTPAGLDLLKVKMPGDMTGCQKMQLDAFIATVQGDEQLEVQQLRQRLGEALQTIDGLREQDTVIPQLQRQVRQLQQALDDAHQQLAESDKQLQVLEQLETTWLAEKAAMDAKVAQLQQAMSALDHTVDLSAVLQRPPAAAERSWQSTDISMQCEEDAAPGETNLSESAELLSSTLQQQHVQQPDNMQALQNDLEAARMQTGLPACSLASSLAAARAELDAVKQELDEQHAVVAELQQQLHLMQQQLAASEQNAQQLQQMLGQKERLLQELQELQACASQGDLAVRQHQSTAQEDVMLQRAQELQKETMQQLAEAQAAAAAAQEDAKHLQQALQVAEAQAAAESEQLQADHQHRIESLQQQLHQSQMEVQGMQEQLQQAQAAKAGVEVRLQEHAADMTRLRSESLSAKDLQGAAEIARTLAEQEVQVLQHQVHELSKQLQESQQSLADAAAAAANSRLEIVAALVRSQDATQSLKQQVAAATDLEQKATLLKQQLAAAQTRMHTQVSSLQSDLSSLQQQLAGEQSRSAQLQLQLGNLKGQLEAQQRQQQDAVSAAGQQTRLLQQELDSYRSQVAVLQQQVLEATSAEPAAEKSNVADNAHLEATQLDSGVQQGLIAENTIDRQCTAAGMAAAAAHHSELARLAMELAQSRRDLQEAQKAAAQWQQQAAQLRHDARQDSIAQYAAAKKQQAAKYNNQVIERTIAAVNREAVLAAENRDLVVRLSATHKKLKLLRSRSQQREALQEAKVCDLEYELHTKFSSYSSPRCSDTEASLPPERPSSNAMTITEDGRASASGAEISSMQAEVEAYKKALYAAQEEAAAAISSAAEARAQAEALTTVMEMQSRKEAFRRQTSKRLLSNAADVDQLMPESSLQEVAAAAAGEDGDVDFAALAGRLMVRQQQIEHLTAELEAANTKRAELARVNALLTQQLADHDHMMRALRHEASDMAQQLSLAQESIAFKEKIIEQLKALCNSVDLAGLGLAPDGGSVQGVSGSSTPSHGAWHSSSSSPGHVAGGSDRRELSRQSSKGLASQHAVGKIASAWKESSKMKDLRIEELTFQLGQVSAQLGMAHREAEELQQQLASSKAEASAGTAALAAAQAKAAGQLQVLDSQLASKEAGLAAAEARLQALGTELRSANSKVASVQKQLELSESEVARLKEAAATAATRLSSCQEELAAAKQDASSKQQALEAAKQDVAQAVSAATSEHQQLSQLQTQVGKLATVLQQLLASVRSGGTVSGMLDAKPGANPVKALSDLVDLVAAELTRRLRDAAAAATRIADLEARMADRAEEVAQLQGTLKAQTDKIFSQQSALGKSQEELRSLRAQLEKRAAQQELIEAEIARQVEEYGRLKKQLVNQEELQAAVATKTEQLSYASTRCSDLEVQLARALEQAAANSQGLASLKVAADSAARAQAEAAVQRQEALANLEVARAELEKVQQQLALAQAAAEKKGQEVRELNHMLKAWEAMRLGKDAQIAALMERCKRNEEDAAEKARTVEALRRKLALAGRPGSSGSGSIALGSTIGGPAASYTFGAGNSGMLVQHAASGSLAGSYYTSGGAAPGSPGVSALRRSWAAESAGFGGSPAGSPTRSSGSYGPFS